MPGKEIVVVGASAGGLEAMKELVGKLPRNFPGSVFIVWHTAPDAPGVLPKILAAAGGELPAANARNYEQIQPGRIYVAPPDHHLLIERGVVLLSRGPKENRFRPAVDPLFRSAAQAYGPRVAGVILSGGLDDGTAGLLAVKQRGGTAIVQDPAEALYPSMPQSAMKHVAVDYCLPAAAIASLLVRLTSTPEEAEGAYPVSEQTDFEVKVAKEDKAINMGIEKLGTPSLYTCPECHGVLSQLREGSLLRFRCHTGHAFSIDSLLAATTEAIEESLWSALRSVQESVLLMRHMAEHLSESDNGGTAELFLQKAREAEARAELVRRAVMNHEQLSEDKPEDAANKA